MKSLIFIADYGTDTLATNEVLNAIRREVSASFPVQVVASRPFNTIHTSFLFQQLQLNLSGAQAKETVFFLNTDPRTQTKEAVKRADGSPLVAGVLKNGALVITPNAGYCLSFVKSSIQELFLIPVPKEGSQFRSRDIFSHIVAEAIRGTLDLSSKEKIDPEQHIPSLSGEPIVLHNDNYGNIKTSLQKDYLAGHGTHEGDIISIKIGGIAVENIQVGSNIFAVPAGSLVLAPGSSGNPQNPYYEIALRFDGNANNSAAEVFKWPEPGTQIVIGK